MQICQQKVICNLSPARKTTNKRTNMNMGKTHFQLISCTQMKQASKSVFQNNNSPLKNKFESSLNFKNMKNKGNDLITPEEPKRKSNKKSYDIKFNSPQKGIQFSMHIYRIPTRVTEIQKIASNSKSFLSNNLPKLKIQMETESPKKLPLLKEKFNYSVDYGSEDSLDKFSPTFNLDKKLLSNEETKYSKRISFQQRMGMNRCPLLIIYFEGVIGDIFRTNLFGKNNVHYFLRNKCLEGLQSILKLFQVAILFSMKKKKFDPFYQYLTSKGIRFDAIYKKNNRYNTYLHDYSQILFDFNRNEPDKIIKKVAILTTSSILEEEFSDGVCIESNYDVLYKYFYCIPIISADTLVNMKSEMKYSPTPVSIVLPNLRCHKQLKALSMAYIAKLLVKIFSHQEEFDIHGNTSNDIGNLINSIDWFISYRLIIRNCCEKYFYSFESTDLYEYLIGQIQSHKVLRSNIKEISNKCMQVDFTAMKIRAIKSVSDYRRYPFLNSMINTNEILFTNIANDYERESERRRVRNEKPLGISSKIPQKFKNCFILVNPVNCKLAPLEKINEEPIFIAVFPGS